MYLICIIRCSYNTVLFELLKNTNIGEWCVAQCHSIWPQSLNVGVALGWVTKRVPGNETMSHIRKHVFQKCTLPYCKK